MPRPGEIASAGLQERMGQTVRLQRLKTFEVKQRLDHSEASRIAIGHRHDVGMERFPDRGIARDRFVESLPDEGCGKIAMIEPGCDAMRHRAFERMMVQNIDGEKQRKFRLAPDRLFRFLPDSSK